MIVEIYNLHAISFTLKQWNCKLNTAFLSTRFAGWAWRVAIYAIRGL